MGFFNNFPYTNFHELNIDFLLKEMEKLKSYVEQYTAINSVGYAGIWDITKQYPQWSVVTDGNRSYLSKKPVPVGIEIENEEYWLPMVDLDPRIGSIINTIGVLQALVEQQGKDIQSLTEKTNETDSKVDDAISDFSPRKLAVFHDNDNADPLFYTTDDGDHFNRVTGPFVGLRDCRDGSLMWHPTFKMLYMACTNYEDGSFIIYYTKDFINWNKFADLPYSDSYSVYWAPSLDISNTNPHLLIAYMAAGTSLASEKSILRQYVTLDDSGIPISATRPTFIFGPNFIDPELVIVGGMKYLAVKNETTKQIEFWTTESPYQKVTTPPTMPGIEGPCVGNFVNRDYLYVDYYYSDSEPLHGIQNIVRYCITNGRYSEAHKVVFSDCLNDAIQGRRHGSIIDCPAEIQKSIVKNCKFDTGSTTPNNAYGTRYVVLNTLNPQNGFTIIPNYIYIIQGTGNITIPSPFNPYGLSEYPILIQTDAITITFIESDGSYTYDFVGQAGKMLIMKQGQDTVFAPCGVVPNKK